MKKVAVMLDNFGHDRDGNPIARHTVFAYANVSDALDSPSAELYQSKTRRQVGYSEKRDDWAGPALEKAKVSGATFVEVQGNRSNGVMWLIYKQD